MGEGGIRFRESMPKPLMLTFLVFAAAGIGLIVVLMLRPPTPNQLALELRRSAPVGSLTHDVVEANLLDIPTPLPSLAPPCQEVDGLIVEGGDPAVDRIVRALGPICSRATQAFAELPPEAQQALRALSEARIRFALFTRTGDQSTADLEARRILLSVALARTNVAPIVITPLLAHEGWHLAHGGPATAAQEYGARLAELQVCRRVTTPDRFTRGCLDAQAIVLLGEQRAIDLLVRAGFPR